VSMVDDDEVPADLLEDVFERGDFFLPCGYFLLF